MLTLWAAVVAARLGFKPDEALSLGKALAGLNAQSKGRRLGIFKPTPKEINRVRDHQRGEEFRVELLGRALPAVNIEKGVRAVIKSKRKPQMPVRSTRLVLRCGRCRAYEPHGTGPRGIVGVEYRCTLGYHQVAGVPGEPCPKPMTIDAMLKAQNDARQWRRGKGDWY